MLEFIYIIIATFLISLISLVGVLTLFLGGKILDRILLILVSFSAGSLMGGAFLHLLPKTLNTIGGDKEAALSAFIFVLVGFCLFFVMEQFIKWHRCRAACHSEIHPFSYLILFSDGLHNFIDGLIIAGSFVVSPSMGIITTIAVALHEIPQEIGDFGVLVYGGFKKGKALFFNFISAITSVLGGIAGFFLANPLGESIVYLLPFAAGNFLYIAASDLIPEIKHSADKRRSLLHFGVFVLGIIVMYSIKMVMN